MRQLRLSTVVNGLVVGASASEMRARQRGMRRVRAQTVLIVLSVATPFS